MIYTKSLIIKHWLTFLTRNSTKILAVYQRPSGEIVMFIDSLVFMFNLMSLKLSHGYPKHIQSLFNIQPNNLHTVFKSYTGKTYIFHDDIIEKSMSVRSLLNHGVIYLKHFLEYRLKSIHHLDFLMVMYTFLRTTLCRPCLLYTSRCV